MRSRLHLVRAFAITFMAAVLTNASFSSAALAGAPGDAPDLHFVVLSPSGAITLHPSAPAPLHNNKYAHFGSFTSATLSFALFQSLKLDYTVIGGTTGQAVVEVRASAEGTRWTEWYELAPGTVASFDRAARYAQYRVRLLGNEHIIGVERVVLTPVGSVAFGIMDTPVAPTYRVHATRQGMVGGRTANGHIITKRDRFVSLPSWRALSRRGKQEYQVRITYKDRSTVVPVYDVGPWNERDDYWSVERERFGDLPRGYPQDHAAYFDGYNKGVAEKGRVRFPTAVDVGDGAWIDDLGIRGDRAIVEITFLWLGSDPLVEQAPPPAPEQVSAPTAAPPPEPTALPTAVPVVEPTIAPTAVPRAEPTAVLPTLAPAVPHDEPVIAPTAVPIAAPVAPAVAPVAVPAAVQIEQDSAGFKKLQAKIWYEGPKDCASGSAYWTYTTTNPANGENIARWQPALAAEALYEVAVFVPKCSAKKARTASARYLITHRDGQAEVVINQDANGGQWVSLGRFPFAAGETGFVELRDVTGDSMQVLWYDAVKWTPAP